MKKKSTAPAPYLKHSQKPIGKRKLLIFKSITILLPFILLILLEFVLRITGYGNNMRLFKEYEPDSLYWIMNDAVSLKFFTNPENATIGFDEIFRKEKSGVQPLFERRLKLFCYYPVPRCPFISGAGREWAEVYPDRSSTSIFP